MLELSDGLLSLEEWIRTLRTLKPGEWGTKRLLAFHGPSLLCVRYRYDEDPREHLKTVELIVQRRSPAATRAASPAGGSLDTERGRKLACVELSSSRAASWAASAASGPLEPGAESDGSRKPGGWAAVAATRKVALRIGLRERDLQRRVKSAGGRWDRDRRVWFVTRDVAERLGLLGRVVGGPF